MQQITALKKLQFVSFDLTAIVMFNETLHSIILEQRTLNMCKHSIQ